MSDTRQSVTWSLQRACRYRSGDNWFLPRETGVQLANLQTVARAAADNRIFDGICVTALSVNVALAGNLDIDIFDASKSVACCGFRVADRLAACGGFANATEVCGACEANAKTDHSVQVAGCHGWLDVDPDDEGLEFQLRQLIEAHGLADRMESVFEPTTPLWYGLWITSPLGSPQVELIEQLLGLLPDDAGFGDAGFSHLLHALRAAIDADLPLHVRLPPLGHIDSGWYTIFPHCPRCQAAANVKHWQGQYSSEPYPCRACGQVYNLNDTHSCVPDDDSWSDDLLSALLGQSRYAQFAREYLEYRGCPPDEALAILRRHFLLGKKAN